MSERYPGGFITKAPVTPTTSAASGIWTLDQAMQYIKAGTWPLQQLYWIGLLGGAVDETAESVAVDSSGNVYILGTASGSTIQIAKYNTSGTIQWQRTLGPGSASAYGVAVDSSGNVYVGGYVIPGASFDIQIAKYNTSGTIQWQRKLSGYPSNDYGVSIALDSSGNVYVGGYTTLSGSYYMQVVKCDNSGVIQWQRTLGGTGDSFGTGIAVDSSGNIYFCGYSTASGTYDFEIAKYNTSGAIQWQRRLGSAPGDCYSYSVAVDSSGNVYVLGYQNGFQLAKYNTSGTIQWQRKLGSGSWPNGGSVAVDSSGNVYVCGDATVGTKNFQIAKYDTSGAIQWQRSLGGSADDSGRGIALDSLGNVYVCGYSNASGTIDFLFAKLPNNGSLTGTYTVGGYSFVYAASTLTDSATTLTDAATSLTDAASSLTDSASTLTDAASTLTSSVTLI